MRRQGEKITVILSAIPLRMTGRQMVRPTLGRRQPRLMVGDWQRGLSDLSANFIDFGWYFFS